MSGSQFRSAPAQKKHENHHHRGSFQWPYYSGQENSHKVQSHLRVYGSAYLGIDKKKHCRWSEDQVEICEQLNGGQFHCVEAVGGKNIEGRLRDAGLCHRRIPEE